ncbi:MAG TPA: HAD hydrolase family protein [Armatimonadaceae bacterium]|nr:HAD hydrolase family protein [Armatimonadaceae bacterium]
MATPDPLLSDSLRARLARVRLIVLDVDGTLTDGTVTYTDDGRELKSFHIHDGIGMVLCGFVGVRIAWITGRKSVMVERRAQELGVTHLYQKIRDKATALAEIALREGVSPEEMAFMGDDLIDLPAFRNVGVAIAPGDAVPEVRAAAHLVTVRDGGRGAAREAIEAILRARGDYDAALGAYLLSLSQPRANTGQ